MNRRNFIKSMIALGAAPAIVKAESIMKIWTPPEKKIMTLADWARESRSIGKEKEIFDILMANNTLLDSMNFIPAGKHAYRAGLPNLPTVLWQKLSDSTQVRDK